MGQSQINSVRSALPPHVAQLTDRVLANANEIHQTASLTYEKFLESLATLSQLASKLSTGSGKQLVFLVKKGTDDTLLWKSTVRVKCYKVNCVTNVIEGTRVLTLKQYVRLYNEISRHATYETTSPPSSSNEAASSAAADATCSDLPAASCLDASAIFSGLDAVVTAESSDGEKKEKKDDEECVICMDRRSQVILPCTHAYCEQCIDAWQASHKNCPICRATVKHANESWILSEKPDASEMTNESTSYVLSLLEKYPNAVAGDSDSD